MDYGHSSQSSNTTPEQPFFTSGAGTNSDSSNNFEPENNLDLSSNQAASWDAHQAGGAVQAEKQAIISPSEAPEAIFPNSPEDSGQPAELGQIVNLEMPPNAEPLPPTNQEGAMGPELPAEPFNRNNIRTKEKLEPSGIREVDNLFGKLDRDQDIASFYDAARKMMTANLENSYGDQAIWKGKAA